MKYLLIIVLVGLAGCNQYNNDTTLVKSLYPVAEFTGFVDDPTVCRKIAAFLNNEQQLGGFAREFSCVPSQIFD